MSLAYYLQKARSLPLRIALQKAAHRLLRESSLRLKAWQESLKPTYTSASLPGGIATWLEPFPPDCLQAHGPWLLTFAERTLRHEFDLLGSGWIQVQHGLRASGVEGHAYPPGACVQPDRGGEWLRSRINRANLPEARRIWRLVSPGYVPIDWQLDFKSGYRWSERQWSQGIAIGTAPSADIKLPWELARMQHLPSLALAYGLARTSAAGALEPETYRNEFRNQVLDFIATNPPRYGANWACAMDVGIRVANWLVAYDLFRAHGASFDPEFERVLARSVFEHGRHIVGHLEYEPAFRSNHYLANIVGLLFVAAHLPASPHVEAWLAFAIQELMTEVGEQFHPEGSNFEASTSYHRLSAEMVAYGTALVLGIPEKRLAALERYDASLGPGLPPLRQAPIPLRSLDTERRTPLPPEYFQSLERMALFTARIAHPGGRVPQIGDNDSGRWIVLGAMGASDILDHRSLVTAINALFERADLEGMAGSGGLEAQLVRLLSGSARLPQGSSPDPLVAYPSFGVYVLRDESLHLVVRCGSVGQKGLGGHAHNDQLSVELSVRGIPFLVDPGTYLYTPSPSRRNQFRSTLRHSTLAVDGQEQNPLESHNVFQMQDRAHARMVEFSEGRFVGEHIGFGVVHRRSLILRDGTIQCIDEGAAHREKIVSFVLHPDVVPDLTESGIVLRARGATLELSAECGSWQIEKAEYSPGYGLIQPTTCVRLRANEMTMTTYLREVNG